jgi:hypothetical protein
MKRLFGCWALAAGALALLLAVSVGGGAAPAPTVIHTQWEIEALAMSGSRVAYDVSGASSSSVTAGCKNKVLVRDLGTGITRRVSGRKTCSADGSSTGDGVRELAVAGKRLGWIVNQGGNTQSYDYLRTASMPRPSEKKLASAARFGDMANLAGNWIGGLLGAGNQLVVNGWSTDSKGAITRSELDVAGGRGLRRLVAGWGAIFAQSADAGRIAVLRVDESVGIYNLRGKLLLQVEPSSAKEIALQSNNLLVLTKTGTLEVYDSHSGAHRRSWPVARGATNLDVYAGVAVYAEHPAYTIGRLKVHVLRLATGKDVVAGVALFRGRPRRTVQIEPPGLVYAKNGHTLVFMPLRRLLAVVS